MLPVADILFFLRISESPATIFDTIMSCFFSTSVFATGVVADAEVVVAEAPVDVAALQVEFVSPSFALRPSFSSRSRLISS